MITYKKIEKAFKNAFYFRNPIVKSKKNLILQSFDKCVKLTDNQELRIFVAFHNNWKIEDGPYLVIAKTPKFYKQKLHIHNFLDEHIFTIEPLTFIAEFDNKIKQYDTDVNQIFEAPAGILHSIENKSDNECINFCFKALHEKRIERNNRQKNNTNKPKILQGKTINNDWGTKKDFTISSENNFSYSIESFAVNGGKEFTLQNKNNNTKYFDLLISFYECDLTLEVGENQMNYINNNVLYIKNYNELRIKNNVNTASLFYRIQIFDNLFFDYLTSIHKTVSCNYRNIFKYFEPINKLKISSQSNKTVVFDFHGTITIPTWVSELEKI